MNLDCVEQARAFFKHFAILLNISSTLPKGDILYDG